MVLTEKIIITFILAASALIFGLGYAEGNQHTYLINGLIQINPNFIIGDWFAHETIHYHGEFANIIVLLDKLGIPLKYGLVSIEIVLRLLGFLAIYKIVETISNKHKLVTFLLVLVPVILESTRSVGDSYIFSTTLQPSTFGSTFTLLGILFFLKTKYLISGILLAIAGYMHTNFLLLSFVYIGLAHIFIGKENFLPRTIKQFTPLLIILVIKLPILFAMISSENGELATYIFQFIRSPFHYVPNTYLMDFYLICGWSIVGIASIYILNVEEALKRHLIAIYASLLIFVLIATLLTTVTFIPFISKLFVWRIAPFCNLLSQIFFVSALINFAFQQSNNSPNKHLLSIGLIGIGGLFIFRWYAYAYGITAFNTFLIIGLFGFLLILTSRNYLDRFLGSINLQTVKYLSMALVGLSLIYGYNSYFFKISSFVNNYPGTAEKQLYSWVKSSPENSIFVTPLELDSFRILGERAVVVDWRSTPVDPDGLIEWYKRVEDVSGVNEFKNLEDAQNGYLTMDAARLENLKDLYSADYAVLFNNQNISLLNFKTVYKNEKYAVLAIE